ncbi:MAG: tetratricopeptide repeat protein [Planctomycetes bacterium]|nr:tetratricopeptide repeat protein [Planctomycetota bacterium]
MSKRINGTLSSRRSFSGGVVAAALLAVVVSAAMTGCKAQPADLNEPSKMVFPGRGADAKAFGYTRDGNWAMSQGRFVDALEAYTLALSYQPEDADAHYGAGQCLLALGNPADAVMHLRIAYDEAWARRTESFDKAGYLAEALQRAGRCEEAVIFLEQRAMAGGSMPEYLRWAEYAAKCNDPDMAERVYLMAIRLDDGDLAEAYYRFGLFYEQVGNIDGAMKRWRQAYGLDPNDPAILDGLSRYVQVVGPTLKLPPDRPGSDM